MIGRWHGLVIDCPDPGSLASFYEQLLGMIRVQDDGDWVVIGDAEDRPGVAFSKVPDYQPPRWPDPQHPQQMHFDVHVEDLDRAEKEAVELGATRLPSPGDNDGCRVFVDPAGHPFCLITM